MIARNTCSRSNETSAHHRLKRLLTISEMRSRRFLDWFRHHHPGQDLEVLAAEHILAAVEHRLSLSATSGTRTAATSHIRTFLRFLCWAGHHDQDLDRVVPRTPHWCLAHLPPRLAWDDVRRAIDAIGATTPVDIRDRAVLLLLATTGIRNGELRAIQLQDIDWRDWRGFGPAHQGQAGSGGAAARGDWRCARRLRPARSTEGG